MGGSGGSYSSMEIGKITQAANERLQGALREQRVILFACHKCDQNTLERLLASSTVFKSRPINIISDLSADLGKAVAEASLLICYAKDSEDHQLISEVIRIALAKKMQTIFVKGDYTRPVPNIVLQFRIRTLSWTSLLEVLA